MEFLAAFLARRDDVVLQQRIPNQNHLSRLKSAGFVLPEFHSLDQIDDLADRKLKAIRPWSVAPNLRAVFSSLENSCSASTFLWDSKYKELFSRAEHVAHFSEWMLAPEVCDDVREIDKLLSELSSWKAVCKSPFSAAGRGVRILPNCDSPTGKNWQWLRQTIQQQTAVVIEPFHERVFDFSVQYHFDGQSLKRLGLIRQSVTANGQYRGSIAAGKFCQGLPTDLAKFLMNEALSVYEPKSKFGKSLSRFLSAKNYSGPVGVDAYVFRDSGGNLCHRPVCEINPRYTMGRLALEIRKQIAPGHDLKFEICRNTDAPEDQFSVNEKGQLCSGTFRLNDSNTASRFVAVITVAKNAEEL